MIIKKWLTSKRFEGKQEISFYVESFVTAVSKVQVSFELKWAHSSPNNDLIDKNLCQVT